MSQPLKAKLVGMLEAVYRRNGWGSVSRVW